MLGLALGFSILLRNAFTQNTILVKGAPLVAISYGRKKMRPWARAACPKVLQDSASLRMTRGAATNLRVQAPHKGDYTRE